MNVPRYVYALVPLGLVGIPLACSSQFGNDPQSGGEPNGSQAQAVGSPSPSEVALDPTTVPKFAQQLNHPRGVDADAGHEARPGHPEQLHALGGAIPGAGAASGFPGDRGARLHRLGAPQRLEHELDDHSDAGGHLREHRRRSHADQLGGQHPAAGVPGGRSDAALGESAVHREADTSVQPVPARLHEVAVSGGARHPHPRPRRRARPGRHRRGVVHSQPPVSRAELPQHRLISCRTSSRRRRSSITTT